MSEVPNEPSDEVLAAQVESFQAARNVLMIADAARMCKPGAVALTEEEFFQRMDRLLERITILDPMRFWRAVFMDALRILQE